MRAPRWARALLARLAEPEVRDEVVGDLEEAHRRREERRGRLGATILTSLEALDMAFALLRRRRRIRRRGTPPVSWLDFKLGLRMLARRTREIGVRVALGAERGDIVFTTFSRMGRRVAIGVLLGSVPGLLVTWELSARSVSPSAGTVALALAYLVVMMTLCMAACLVPTRRALAIQPTEALAAEG